MENKVLKRDFVEKDNIIIIKEETERTIDRRDLDAEIARLDRKREKLNYMLAKLQSQIADVERERDSLISIVEREKI